MNEEKEKNTLDRENMTSRRENTIDILVDPKRKEEPDVLVSPKKNVQSVSKSPVSTPKNASSAPKSAASVSKSAPDAPKNASSAPKKSRSGLSGDHTRAVSAPTFSRRQSAVQKAEETRLGNVLVSPAEKKKAAAPKPLSAKSEAKAKKKTNPEEKGLRAHSFRSTIVLALIYISVVVLISAALSYFGIRWANDVFALVKDEVVSTVSIPENATISEVAGILEDHGIIEFPSIFRLYISYKNRAADPPLAFKAGDYEIKSTLNYDQIVSLIKDRKTRRIVTITIPEGYTTDEIIELFVSQGIGTREGFADAINNFPYEYTFMEKLNAISLSPDRRYRLEGYLFPDTYDFYTDSKEIAIVDKLLTAFEAHFESAYYDRLEELNMNLDEIVTLASIIQTEGKYNSDFYPISGVFHNRLKSSQYPHLESDATVQYCLGERKEDLSYADLELDNPYNTYRIDGLPPSAISNPGWEAIQAALYPETHRHYYFISDTDGSTIFADTLPQHLNNVALLQKAKQNGTTID